MNAEKQKLDSLEAELKEIEAKLSEVKQLEERRIELRRDIWGIRCGEIAIAKQAYADSLYPVFEEATGRLRHKRIVNVDSKWISIKRDGDSDSGITRYKIENGWPERSRDGSYALSADDISRALEVWNGHQSVVV